MADIRHRGGQTMSYFSKRALRWTAPVALVGALGLAACGGNDSDEAIRTNAGPVAQASGLDNHLDIRATELAQQERAYRAAAASVGLDNHLDIRAAEIATRTARLAAEAERAERSAKLEGQAETYRSAAVPTNSDANLPDAWVAGSRAVEQRLAEQQYRASQMAQAEQYVQQQIDRAESNSSGNRAAQAAEAERYVDQQQDRADGNRAVQMTQAPAYVWQQQDRAESNSSGNDSYDDDFLPGGHHVPSR
jgi:hypothetical protein